ncbi:acyl-CoA reductase-like NAD-dependent aldehyde dehydrogenase [Streptomyces sp. SAI-144]|uniref:aldehyde dehydrogenase family protein n=1 Tax=Streptomyces sp. SAI-144 TaxID=2940544 RepID=UPI002473F759|nr:aldehyde dehydrogenase family protein [Streptomyces sp. SAI-144]MDH6436750.1 acyl-CoA reductase-like NAD-dependent aldehyde dehydrogenase [Streptomyces sp. SAI-144]
MGPVRNEVTLWRIAEHVEDARSKGADVVQFGKEEGLFFPATILTGVTTEMRIAQEETFGPVAPVIKVSSAREAVEIGQLQRPRTDRVPVDPGRRRGRAGPSSCWSR